MQRKFTIKRNTIKKVVRHGKSAPSDTISSSITGKTEAEDFHLNIITSSRVDTTHASRLRAPIEAESTAHKSKRKLRAAKNFALKSAPPIPTAPKDPLERKRRWLLSQAKIHIKLIDLPIIITTVLLSVLGVFAVYSTTLSYGSDRYVTIQFFGMSVGIVIAVIMSLIDYRSIASKYHYILGLNVFILLFTLVFGEGIAGSTTNQNWINIGPIQIQPSEFSKLLFIFSFASHLSLVRDRMHKFSTVISLAIHALLIFGLILLQGDIGILTIFFIIFICMCFAAGISMWYYVIGAVGVVCASPFLWAKLDTYQKNRILLCFDPSIDPLGKNERYQQMWSEKAIGNGGITGTGFTKGTTIQNFDSPQSAKHTDMIFSSICEELGMIGALIILALTVFIIFRALRIALKTENLAGRYICVGIASMFMIQVIENVGMCLGVLPVIGITYPFLSYGGSSIISCFIAIGMVLSVSTHREQNFFSQ